jgi:hypothetical protein
MSTSRQRLSLSFPPLSFSRAPNFPANRALHASSRLAKISRARPRRINSARAHPPPAPSSIPCRLGALGAAELPPSRPARLEGRLPP